MSNFMDNLTGAERERAYAGKLFPRATTNGNSPAPLQSSKSKDDPIIYIMLSSGRVQKLGHTETPTIPLLPSQPNYQLIRKLSRFLTEFGIPHKLQCPNKDATVISWREHPAYICIQERLIIKSLPFNGVSYIHVVRINPAPFQMGCQMNLSFVAVSVMQVCSKLMEYKLIDFGAKGESIIRKEVSSERV